MQSLLPYLESPGLGTFLDVRLFSRDPDSLDRSDFPFCMVRDSHSLTRAVSAGLVSDAAFPLKDVLLLLQKDGCTPACAYAR